MQDFSYFASWEWAASKGIPDPNVLSRRIPSLDPVWGFHPADAFPPPRRVFTAPACTSWCSVARGAK